MCEETAQPPTVVGQVGTYANCTHVFACLEPVCVLSWCSLTKFLHRSSVGSLLRVRCWLGGRVQNGSDSFETEAGWREEELSCHPSLLAV